MRSDKLLGGKQPRFFKEPSAEDVETKGWPMAHIHARVQARIVGSRVLNGTVAFGIGTAISVSDVLSHGTVTSGDLVANFGIPVVINGVAQVKVERQLRHTEREVAALLSGMLQPGQAADAAPPPADET